MIIDRRNFFKLSALASGVVAGAFSSPLAAKEKAGPEMRKSHEHALSSSPKLQGRMFFQKDIDFENLGAACQRIWPKDSTPGAKELGVPYFIDNQLASGYGFNATLYMQGPFFEGTPQQGLQSPLNRRDMMLLGLEGLEQNAQKLFQKSFYSLSDEQQDEILKSFEEGRVQIDGFGSSSFFGLLFEMTMAGVFSDPIYQGNENKIAWRLVGFPGAQMSYTEYITRDKYKPIEPMGISDM